MFTHYRSFIDFSFEGLESAKHSLARLYQAINLYKGFKDKIGKGDIKINYLNEEREEGVEEIKDFSGDFYDAMNDDFNTPSALSVIFNLVRKINKIINDSLLSGFINHNDLNFLDEALLFIPLVSDIFGILKENPELFIETNLKDTSKISLTEEEIQAFIEKRNMLRQKREYKMADEIRNMLLEKGVLLEDSNYGTTFKIIN
jgi:Cysteinyl-tRNA synthetase